MQVKRVILVCILVIISTLVLTITVSSQEDTIPYWNKAWSFRQEIQLPIFTNDSYAIYQPIDIRVTFDDPCWAKNENETSIRVLCWKEEQWFELESQIYDLSFREANQIEHCGLVFLVPEIADGSEKYYVYYDDSEKSQPNYKDHVCVEDAYYFDIPISEITAEAKYYCIKEEGYCIYGVGQEGQLLDRTFSQLIVKQKKGVKDFNILDSDQIASFAFSYYYGDDEKDESTSDQSFLYKKIFVDGNLMVEFGIISESTKKDIRTTAIYKYYYSPLEEKRICVRVKHEILKDAVIQGKENIDGRFGALISIKTKNPVVSRMNAGEIFPYLHFFSENDNIEEYQMNLNPESKNREWIICFKDDADLGKEAWIAYGEGKEGKTNSIIFASNEGLISSGTDERDGIQLKVAEREYFRFLGTEIDYASINFGRNSYEKGYNHDLAMPDDLIIEFDAEMFSSETDGYIVVQKEAALYRELVKHRHSSEDSSFEPERKTYDLTVTTHFGGTRFSYPRLANITNRRFPVMWIELWQDGKVISSGAADRSLFIRAQKTFTEIVEGDYLIKVYWKLDNSTKFFNGAKTIILDKDKKVQIFCTWERTVTVTFTDQNDKGIEGITAVLLDKDNFIFDENRSDSNGDITLRAPFNLRDPYNLMAFYKNLVVYEGTLKKTVRKIDVNVVIELYDLTVEVTDEFNLPPGVGLTPTLSGLETNSSVQLILNEIEPGKFFIESIPSGNYKLSITYANFVDEKLLNLPEDGEYISMKFTAMFNLAIDLFDSRGNPLIDEEIDFKIIREKNQVYETDNNKFTLPPARYSINAYSNGDLVGIREISFTNDKTIKLVTTLSSILPIIIIGATLIFIGIIIVFTLIKKISLHSMLKLLAIALVVIALIQPWWGLSASSNNPSAEKDTRMLLNPEVMIESTTYNDKTILDIAEMPNLFVDLLVKIVAVSYTAIILLGLSYICYKFKKKTYSLILIFIVMILLIAIISTFYMGTSKLSEVSVGEVQGTGLLNLTVEEETLPMQASWGFDSGFYLVIVSAILSVFSFFIELRLYIKKKKS